MTLFTAGDQAEIFKWDLRQRKCIGKVSDDGNFSTTTLEISNDGKYLATGSKMGTVNIFDLETVAPLEYLKPVKTVQNLTTSITDMKFNPTS